MSPRKKSPARKSRGKFGGRAAPAPVRDCQLTTCLYRGKNVGDFWSNQKRHVHVRGRPAGVLVANLLEGMKFGLGPTIALRKEALVKIAVMQIFAIIPRTTSSWAT